MELSILYLRGVQLTVLCHDVFLSLKVAFILENNADSDEMSPYEGTSIICELLLCCICSWVYPHDICLR